MALVNINFTVLAHAYVLYARALQSRIRGGTFAAPVRPALKSGAAMRTTVKSGTAFYALQSVHLIHATFQSNCAEGLHFSAFHSKRNPGKAEHVLFALWGFYLQLVIEQPYTLSGSIDKVYLWWKSISIKNRFPVCAPQSTSFSLLKYNWPS